MLDQRLPKTALSDTGTMSGGLSEGFENGVTTIKLAISLNVNHRQLAVYFTLLRIFFGTSSDNLRRSFD